jgi:hypothetical protein
MFACRREEVIPRLRPGISTRKVMIPVFLTLRQLIALDEKILPFFLDEKKRFSGQKPAIKFPVRMDNSMCYNGRRFADELRLLKILRAPHPPYSPDISPCNF